MQEPDDDKLAAVTSSTIAAAVGDTSPMTVSADAALLLAQQHQQQQNEAASAAGISLDDGYMKDDAASFMKDDDAAADNEASEFLKDSHEGLMKDEEPSAGLSITDSASGRISHCLLFIFSFYRMQYSAEGSVFWRRQSVGILFVYQISQEPLNEFVPYSHLKVKDQGSQGEKHFFGPFGGLHAIYVW